MTAAKISAGSVGALRDLQPTFHLELPTLLQTVVVTSIEKKTLITLVRQDISLSGCILLPLAPENIACY